MKYFIFLLVVCLPLISSAQEKCGTQAFNESTGIADLQLSKDQFENWLKTRVHRKRQLRVGDALSETVHQIPVVVHVIHNGTAEGTGANIPNEQITNQIDSLNNDFRRLNADRINTPASFTGVASDAKIEFVMAKRDPEGLPSNGIVRVEGNQSSFTINEAVELASNSYWPAEEYLNIWVADLSNGLLGFAKFPVSNVPGMDDDPNLNRLIDGVFMDYEYFGTGFNADDFSKGRTLTHEIGHWLGLRHIWGDGGCSVDDFCADTPTQGSSSSGCPPVDQTSCSSVDMFQNFMDYTDDVCMNLFTTCQTDRMRIVLESSPRRKDLLSSTGDEAVVQVANDLGIKSIESPAFGNCNVVVVPEVEVRNYGNNAITNFSLDLMVDETVVETKLFNEPLTELQSIFVNFSSTTFSADANQISFKVNQVNGGTDGNSINDCRWVSTFFPSSQTVPYVEEFTGAVSSGNALWNIKNGSNNTSAWGYAVAPNTTTENEAAVLNYFGAASEAFGELDYFISPVFDLSGLSTADLKFKYAYSGFPDNYSDALTVVVSTDCGATFPEENILFQRIGAPLATTTTSSSNFVPEDPSDWLEVEKNFGEFANNSEVVVAFIGNNGGGNNIYVDDIEIFSSAANDNDLGIVQVDDVPIVTCRNDVLPQVFVKNFGKNTVTNFKISYGVGSQLQTMSITDLTLQSGKTESVELALSDIEDGSYVLTIQTSEPNGMTDENTANDSYTANFTIDNETETIPIREQFSKTLDLTDWHFIRRDKTSDWSISEFREGNITNFAATLNGFELSEVGVENWLVSPILDFSAAEKASTTFDLSYANRSGKNDQLKVLASTDCGRTFDLELYNKKGGELAITQSETAWVPDSEDDWRSETIVLNDLVGQDDIRMAFIVTNQNGNNLYLDNIEFYVSDDPNSIVISESMRSFPNPASDQIEIKFNFNIKEEVLIRVVGLDGEVIAEQSFPNTFNQVYKIENLNVTNNGIYLLQVLGEFTKLSSKILIVR